MMRLHFFREQFMHFKVLGRKRFETENSDIQKDIFRKTAFQFFFDGSGKLKKNVRVLARYDFANISQNK